MLTNLDFIRTGAEWPPPAERERLERYEAHRRLFMCGHGEVYEQQLRRIQREVGHFGDIISYAVALNYQRLVSLKTADLLVGEPPEISTRPTAAITTAALRDWLDECGFQAQLYQVAFVAKNTGTYRAVPSVATSGVNWGTNRTMITGSLDAGQTYINIYGAASDADTTGANSGSLGAGDWIMLSISYEIN